MKAFVLYLKNYFRELPLKTFLLTVLFIALLVGLNYTFGIERRIRDLRPWWLSLGLFFLFYSFVFLSAWMISGYPGRSNRAMPNEPVHPAKKKQFLFLLLLAPLYFAFKMIHWDLSVFFPSGWPSPWDRYAQIVLQLPAKLLLLILLLLACRKWTGWAPRVRGFRDLGVERSGDWEAGYEKNRKMGPYFLLLLFLLPLVALASTQHDFLQTYPKLRNITFIYPFTRPAWPWQLLYEISYGLDFVSIEFFFRGLLVVGLARYAGPDVILPMAAFYCTVHFGKPLGECISSFFGGLALGVIAWRTRSIRGGLIVHLGLAMMMEIGGYLGASLL